MFLPKLFLFTLLLLVSTDFAVDQFSMHFMYFIYFRYFIHYTMHLTRNSLSSLYCNYFYFGFCSLVCLGNSRFFLVTPAYFGAILLISSATFDFLFFSQYSKSYKIAGQGLSCSSSSFCSYFDHLLGSFIGMNKCLL